MKYHFISGQRSAHRVEKMARVLGVTRSGYYAWVDSEPSAHEVQDQKLVACIGEIQKKVKHRYGSPRMTRELRRRGWQVGHNRVARLMQEYSLGARVKKAFRVTTKSNHGLPVAPNMLGRQFAVAAANRVWVSDISYVATAEGWLYLCVILDLYSRRVVGWSMGNGLGTKLVIAAFMMAVLRRQPPRRLVFHSDRGVQYCAKAFRRRTRAWGMQQSMSRKGDCWDNACAESFFKSLKAELIGRQIFATREGARAAIFEYIEVFYNRQRLHSYLDYCTPAEFEEGLGTKVAS